MSLPRVLPDAVARLLPHAAPPRWRAAVDRAAQLLAPSWGDGDPPAEVGLLVLAVAVLALDQEPAAADTPTILAAVAEATDAAEAGREPLPLRRRGTAALAAAGQHDPTTGAWTPLGALWRDVLHQWLPEVPTSDIPPAPSVLRETLPPLRAALARSATATAGHTPAPAPEPSALRTVFVSGMIRRVTPGAALPVRCDTCGAHQDLILRLDGPTVTVRCPNRHDTYPNRLDAVRVVQAVRHHGADPAAPAAGIDGHLTVTVHGDVRADPRRVFALD
ncbi:hypothetical protein [Embleya sp. NPDC059237]|uniref:hypothetical protein n=1 Tax=Embleya sp. NPDC059237 TaxID=3346784 RepID=UPI0036A39DA5